MLRVYFHAWRCLTDEVRSSFLNSSLLQLFSDYHDILTKAFDAGKNDANSTYTVNCSTFFLIQPLKNSF